LTNNRSKTEIISQILETASGGEEDDGGGGATKTEIMYKVFLSHDQLQEYLMLLMESGLLSYDSTRHTFKTTENGLTFLQSYNQIDRFLKEQQI
jgi:predicted transcriptional regulator